MRKTIGIDVSMIISSIASNARVKQNSKKLGMSTIVHAILRNL